MMWNRKILPLGLSEPLIAFWTSSQFTKDRLGSRGRSVLQAVESVEVQKLLALDYCRIVDFEKLSPPEKVYQQCTEGITKSSSKLMGMRCATVRRY